MTIQQAARRCSVSDKTIQRAIRAGTLPARYPQPNRCAIALSDLDTFLPGHVQTATPQRLAEQVSGHVQAETERRVAALEQRVEQLEHLVAQLLDRPAGTKRGSRAKARERTTGPLPQQFVSLLVFAERHCVPDAKVQTHAEMGLLPVKRGEWTEGDGTVVTLALDAKGRHAFYRLYRGVPTTTRTGCLDTGKDGMRRGYRRPLWRGTWLALCLYNLCTLVKKGMQEEKR